MRVRVRRDWGKEGGQVFTQLGRGKTHEINLAHVYLQQRHLHPLQTIRGWGGEKKKWGRKSGRNNLEETFPGLLRISFLFPHSLPPFRCFLRNHCLPPLPTCVPYLFYIRYDKKSRLFPGQILYRSLTILSIPTRVIKFSTILHKLIPSKFLSQFFSKCFSTFLEIFRF